MSSKDEISVTAFSFRLIPHIRQFWSDCAPASCLERCYLSAFSLFIIIIVIFIFAWTIVKNPGRTRILWIIYWSYIAHISNLCSSTGILSGAIGSITVATYNATSRVLSYWVLNATNAFAIGYESLLYWWLKVILLCNTGTTIWTFAHKRLMVVLILLLLCVIIRCDLCVIIDLLNCFNCVL